MHSILFVLFFSIWSMISPFKDAECTSRDFFATATIETEIGGAVTCSGTWGFPKVTIGTTSIIKRFVVECTDIQRSKIKDFKDTLAGLSNGVGMFVIQKMFIVEHIITEEKIDFIAYQESVLDYYNEIEKLDVVIKKRLEMIFN